MRVDNAKLRANVNGTARLLADDPTAGHVRPLVKTTLVHNVHARCPVTNLVAKAVPIYERIRLNENLIRDTVPTDLKGRA